ncbi:hypothetical protein KAH94_03365 [bacterium]|nr:hypothetical protein [bacterium]
MKKLLIAFMLLGSFALVHAGGNLSENEIEKQCNNIVHQVFVVGFVPVNNNGWACKKDIKNKTKKEKDAIVDQQIFNMLKQLIDSNKIEFSVACNVLKKQVKLGRISTSSMKELCTIFNLMKEVRTIVNL